MKLLISLSFLLFVSTNANAASVCEDTKYIFETLYNKPYTVNPFQDAVEKLEDAVEKLEEKIRHIPEVELDAQMNCAKVFDSNAELDALWKKILAGMHNERVPSDGSSLAISNAMLFGDEKTLFNRAEITSMDNLVKGGAEGFLGGWHWRDRYGYEKIKNSAATKNTMLAKLFTAYKVDPFTKYNSYTTLLELSLKAGGELLKYALSASTPGINDKAISSMCADVLLDSTHHFKGTEPSMNVFEYCVSHWESLINKRYGGWPDVAQQIALDYSGFGPISSSSFFKWSFSQVESGTADRFRMLAENPQSSRMVINFVNGPMSPMLGAIELQAVALVQEYLKRPEIEVNQGFRNLAIESSDSDQDLNEMAREMQRQNTLNSPLQKIVQINNSKGHSMLISLLERADLNPNFVPESQYGGFVPANPIPGLIIATIFENVFAVKALLADPRTDRNLRDADGKSASDYAKNSRNPEIRELFL